MAAHFLSCLFYFQHNLKPFSSALSHITARQRNGTSSQELSWTFKLKHIVIQIEFVTWGRWRIFSSSHKIWFKRVPVHCKPAFIQIQDDNCQIKMWFHLQDFPDVVAAAKSLLLSRPDVTGCQIWRWFGDAHPHLICLCFCTFSHLIHSSHLSVCIKCVFSYTEKSGYKCQNTKATQLFLMDEER